MNVVRVLIRCRCGETISGWCVRVSRKVPANLQCAPIAGGAAGGGSRAIVCARGHMCFDGPEELERVVEALTGGGWGHWEREGAVVVNCR